MKGLEMNLRDDWQLWKYQDPPRRWLFFLLLGLIAWVLPKIANGQTFQLPCISYSGGCETYSPGAPPQQDGNHVTVQAQFGFEVQNIANGLQQYIGVSTPEQTNRPTDRCPFIGLVDRHQGVRGFRAAEGWLVVLNFAKSGAQGGNCSGVLLWKKDATGRYQRAGQVDVIGATLNAPSSAIGILNGLAYIPTGGGTSWAEVNLASASVVDPAVAVMQGGPGATSWQVIPGPAGGVLQPIGTPQTTPTPSLTSTATPPAPEPTTTSSLPPSQTHTPTPCQPTGPCRPAPLGPGCWDGCSLCPCPTSTPAASRTPTVTIPTASPTSGPPTTTPTIQPSTTPDLTSTPLRMTPVVPPATGTRPPVTVTERQSPSPSPTSDMEATPTLTPTTSPTPEESGDSSGRGGLVAAVVAGVIGLFVWLVKKFGGKK